MHPYIIFGDIKISSFNLMVGLGIIVALCSFEHFERQKTSDLIIDNLMMCIGLSIPFSFLGAMLFDKIMHFRNSNFLKHIFEYTGMSFVGGLLAAALCFSTIYFIVFHSYSGFTNALDIIVPYIALGHAFGRIGCFLGGCCYGVPVKYVLGVRYPKESLAYLKYGDVPLFPSQLVEAVFLFILFLGLKKRKNAALMYIVLYSIYRYIAEYWRGDNRGDYFFGFFSPSQLISFCTVFITIILFIIHKFIRKKTIDTCSLQKDKK